MNTKRERGSTIHRVLDILETVAASDKPISATEINEVLNLPKASVHRLCAELEASGYLLKKIDGKSYMPGNRFHNVAVGALSQYRFRATRFAILTALAEKVGETCNIAYADGLSMAYSDRVETTSPLRLQFPLGSRVPLHCTASGKLFLSTLPKNKRKVVISKLKLEAHAKNTITDVDLLLEEVDKIEALKISIDNEELYDGVIAIAVPITDQHGRFYSSLAIQAPIFRLPVDRAMDYEALLREAAQDLSTLTEEL
jgi:IclR family acetate operon transcriptional repressor